MREIRILHVLGTTNLGGAESRIMDLYRHIDRDRVQFDFLSHSSQEGYFDNEIIRMGGHVYHLPAFRGYNYRAYGQAVKKFFMEHYRFQAVQGHMTSTAGIYLPLAKAAGQTMRQGQIPVTIAHARSAGVDKGLKGWVTKAMRIGLDKRADFLFACSQEAGRAVFGKKAAAQGQVRVIPNAIDASAFVFSPAVREQVRGELGLNGCFVIGHVGRFDYPKNHEYLLRVFAEIVRRRSDARLLLLGDGSGMTAAKEQADRLKITNQVLFMGNQRPVDRFYQAMDYFVFPSRFEGLPGTVVEAQTAGLKCLISDTIAEEVMITGLVEAAGISQTPEIWAEKVLKQAEYERKSRYQEIAAAGYDVTAQAEVMMHFYEQGMYEQKK